MEQLEGQMIFDDISNVPDEALKELLGESDDDEGWPIDEEFEALYGEKIRKKKRRIFMCLGYGIIIVCAIIGVLLFFPL